MYCYEVLHEQLLDNLADVLNESIVAIRNDPKNWTQLGEWIFYTLNDIFAFIFFCFLFTEACIYAFCSIAEHIDSYERKNTPKLMKVLHEIPYENLSDKILGTALETIGKLYPLV